jgi:hypothetical protein
MSKVSWKFVVVVGVVAAAPVACLVVDDGYGPRRVVVGPGAGGGSNGGSGDQCNPVTNDGCPSDGSVCDADDTGHFKCFPPPNEVAQCGSCDGQTTFCVAQLTCVVQKNQTSGSCYRYCCTDADCGTGGACDLALAKAVLQPADPMDKVGLCVAGTSPSCGATPGSPPSGGSCVGGFTGGPPPPSDGGQDGNMMMMGDGGHEGGLGNEAGAPPDSGMPMNDGGNLDGGSGG